MPGDDEYERLKQSIQAFGYVDPIIINSDGTVIGGHQRLNVLKDLGYKEADVAVVDLDKNEEKALNIALNKISGEWDEDKLTEILSELAEEAFPVELTGFSDEELQNLLDDILEAQEEEPKAPDEEHHQPLPPMSKPGDLWLLGNHRLICGDATDEPTIERLMDGEKASMVHTDPPYGVSYETQSGKFGMIMNDDKTHDDLYNTLLLPAFRNYCKNTIEKAAFYIWHSGSTRRDFEDAMTAVGLIENQQIVWVKNGIVLGRADYQWGHEPCFYASKGGISPNFYGDRAQHTVWRAVTRQDGGMMTVLGNGIVLTDGTGGKLYITDKPPKGKKFRYVRMEQGKPIDLFQEDRMSTVWEVSRETNTMHPTQKPVELPIRAIENSSQPGEIVLDFFGGSGSTLMGAEMTGRRCFTTELDPVYCDVIISRYIGHTGDIGCTCIRGGKEIPYIELVREWAKANGEEERINAMKIPIPVTPKMAKASADKQEEEWAAGNV